MIEKESLETPLRKATVQTSTEAKTDAFSTSKTNTHDKNSSDWLVAILLISVFVVLIAIALFVAREIKIHQATVTTEQAQAQRELQIRPERQFVTQEFALTLPRIQTNLKSTAETPLQDASEILVTSIVLSTYDAKTLEVLKTRRVQLREVATATISSFSKQELATATGKQCAKAKIRVEANLLLKTQAIADVFFDEIVYQ